MSKGESYYVWENNNPVKSQDVIRIAGNHECFIIGEVIKPEDSAYWTDEFEAWISERGYQMIQNAHSTSELHNDPQMQIIYGEWYSKDEAISGREEAYHAERMSKSNEDAGLYDEQKTNNLCGRTDAWI